MGETDKNVDCTRTTCMQSTYIMELHLKYFTPLIWAWKYLNNKTLIWKTCCILWIYHPLCIFPRKAHQRQMPYRKWTSPPVSLFLPVSCLQCRKVFSQWFQPWQKNVAITPVRYNLYRNLGFAVIGLVGNSLRIHDLFTHIFQDMSLALGQSDDKEIILKDMDKIGL